MLPPVTKKISDHSTDRHFAFEFVRDACGSAWESEHYPFSLADDPARSESEKRAHEILWKAEHDAAYERANTEALFHFNKCPECGKRVCDSCFSEVDVICTQPVRRKQPSITSNTACEINFIEKMTNEGEYIIWHFLTS